MLNLKEHDLHKYTQTNVVAVHIEGVAAIQHLISSPSDVKVICGLFSRPCAAWEWCPRFVNGTVYLHFSLQSLRSHSISILTLSRLEQNTDAFTFKFELLVHTHAKIQCNAAPILTKLVFRCCVHKQVLLFMLFNLSCIQVNEIT